jgi:XisH protein
MPALDACHPHIAHALQKAGWTVSPVPHAIRAPGRRYPLLADIRASRGQEEIIIVEVKCFLDDPLVELYMAIGQYMVYRSLLQQSPRRPPLYLAIPNYAYHGIFKEIGLAVVNDAAMNLIVVDLDKEVVEQWITP